MATGTCKKLGKLCMYMHSMKPVVRGWGRGLVIFVLFMYIFQCLSDNTPRIKFVVYCLIQFINDANDLVMAQVMFE